MNSNKYLSHDELQHIEHANKVLETHLELVKVVVNETEALLSTYLPILRNYCQGVLEIRADLGKEVEHIIQSSRQLSIVTSNTQNLINFTIAVERLNNILTPELLDKLSRLIDKEQS